MSRDDVTTDTAPAGLVTRDDVRDLANAVRLLLRAVEDLTSAPAMNTDYGLSYEARREIEAIVMRLRK